MSYPRSKKAVSGPENNVPCPWCGKHNDHTQIKEQARDTGALIICDGCENIYRVQRIDRTIRITVVQYHGEID